MHLNSLKNLATLTLVAALGLSLGACKNLGKKNKQYAGVDGDYVSGTPLADRQEGVSFTGNNVDKKKFPAVHFGFDSVEVTGSDRPILEQVASYLSGSSETLIIAGFTDERGTTEYNRSLGERRAQAVRQHLIEGGAKADKIQTVSFGAEMPVDSASNEAAWAKNRRAEFGFVK